LAFISDGKNLSLRQSRRTVMFYCRLIFGGAHLNSVVGRRNCGAGYWIDRYDLPLLTSMMGYNHRNDEIRDNVERMRREWQEQRDTLATVRRFNAVLSTKTRAWFWPKIPAAIRHDRVNNQGCDAEIEALDSPGRRSDNLPDQSSGSVAPQVSRRCRLADIVSISSSLLCINRTTAYVAKPTSGGMTSKTSSWPMT